jgi:pyrroline-5-carboxylate reductase
MAVRLIVVGGGKMGSALVSGLISANWAEARELAVVEPDDGRREVLGAQHDGLVLFDSPPRDQLADDGGAVLAVKPEAAASACRSLQAAGINRVLSIVAGLATQRIESGLAEGSIVVRAMPNTPALIGAGVAAISGGTNARSIDLDWAESILAAVGKVVRLPERHLDAVTGLSGSGPAYFFLVAESMIEAGVSAGLTRDVSRTLVVETLLGSARLLAETGESPEELRSAVTSPGGTTAAGLRALEQRAVRSAFLEAVLTATERSRQLGH